MSQRDIGLHIACIDITSDEWLGSHRWVIERTIARLGGFHRLDIRYDHKDTPFCAFLTRLVPMPLPPN
ncbi:hypothetical protein [Nocardia sp. 2YAB30]|uniref:hypothetical protein n=1 Tax=Nocardia sp. 2YAB30 TaxID=3233022 RepID=UPI003F95C825